MFVQTCSMAADTAGMTQATVGSALRNLAS